MQRATHAGLRRFRDRARFMRAGWIAATLAVLPVAARAQAMAMPYASMHLPAFGTDAVGGGRSWLSPRIAETERIAGLLYVSYAGAEVLIYDRSIPNQLLGELYEGTCFPTGLAVDDKHRLYVDSLNPYCPSLTIFHQGVAAPGTTLTRGLYAPVTVAVSAKDGTIYTVDAVGRNILRYDHGRTGLKEVLYSTGVAPFTVALDRNDVLYASYTDAAGAHVGRYDANSRGFVDLGIKLVLAGPIVFDADDNLLVGDQRTGIISAYAPGSTTPIRTYSGFSDPYAMTLDVQNTVLYVSDPGNRTVDELSYPSGRRLGAIRGFSYNTFGVAVTSPTKREGH